jgi:ribosomal protein L11 methylase PrmA
MIKAIDPAVHKSSFRDPSGFVFVADGKLLRHVGLLYKDHYDCLVQSGLKEKLLDQGLIIPFEEVQFDSSEYPSAYKILRPVLVPFISYPFEWCFSQLKDAALAMLSIQSLALENGMSLKDASAYNFQFLHGKPILIDVLSFEKYRENKPWVALQQFCQHFLAPLALMSSTDVRLSQLLRVNVDGIPLDLASALLPLRSWLIPSLFFYIHAHALAQRRSGSSTPHKRIAQGKFGLDAFKTMINHLRETVSGLKWAVGRTRWSGYSAQELVESEYFRSKHKIISEFVDSVKPQSAWDLGANTGLMSRLLSSRGVSVISMDADYGAIEKNYQETKTMGETRVLPLVIDLNNPSPALGWSNEERQSLFERGRPDLILCLALIHHLAIGNNLPLRMVAKLFHGLTSWLIIEFIPKSDPNLQKMMTLREDIFTTYDEQNFVKDFQQYFEMIRKEKVANSDRVLYLMKSKRN